MPLPETGARRRQQTVPEDHLSLSLVGHQVFPAGIACGSHEHTHFVFAMVELENADEEFIRPDPWNLFRQMYADRRLAALRGSTTDAGDEGVSYARPAPHRKARRPGGQWFHGQRGWINAHGLNR